MRLNNCDSEGRRPATFTGAWTSRTAPGGGTSNCSPVAVVVVCWRMNRVPRQIVPGVSFKGDSFGKSESEHYYLTWNRHGCLRAEVWPFTRHETFRSEQDCDRSVGTD
jgi:hypothetical protein